jgi:hypothetical protein
MFVEGRFSIRNQQVKPSRAEEMYKLRVGGLWSVKVEYKSAYDSKVKLSDAEKDGECTTETSRITLNV